MNIKELKEKIKDLPDDADLFIIINHWWNNEIDSIELEAVHFEGEDSIDFTRLLLKYKTVNNVVFSSME